MTEEQPKKEQTAAPQPAQPEEQNPLEAANRLVERLEAANKRSEELLRRQETLAAQALLGGRATAGQAPPVKPEETPAEYSKRILRGELTDDERKAR